MKYSISWNGGAILTTDQRSLPHQESPLRLTTVDGVIDAIRTLAVRGAPAIGIAGAFGVALSALRHGAEGATAESATAEGAQGGDAQGGSATAEGSPAVGALDERAQAAVRADAARIADCRPTAVNLSWAVARVLTRLPEGPQAILAEAEAILAEDARANRAAARRAADLVEQLCPDRPLRALTHCNTGRLATAAGGTALGAILELAERGRIVEVLVDETRPLLQGSRLTAWELAEADVPYRICVDSAAAFAMAQGLVDVVLVGADRISRNGDVANKIGTYGLALAAARHGIPLVVVAPESTVDEALESGSGIVVEERRADEVTSVAGTRTAPAGAGVYNPAFDVTPGELVTAVVTESRVLEPARDDLAAQVAAHTVHIPDHPIEGVDFQDLMPVYTQPWLVDRLARAVITRFRGEFDHVAGIEARGFLLGMAIAQAAECSFVPLRKPGKLPPPVHAVEYELEYGTDTLELGEEALPAGARVLIVDDVLATGGTAAAAAKLVGQSGAVPAGCAVILELTGLAGRDRLSLPVFAVRAI
ncbi:S-methyl-5-thioribose-1-phosphate isomerase [Streptomyces sp. NBC_01142]|uniref:S-methyl-5-thioribose-1-phosphate isomerase n=1 Tax=Streptomyces sp. NBC_01142 TaxID=2975865 RepID=UPI002258FDCB|nr:S-methyl-5-thioribose-1-phosphate isomerase [Streptomyces sp. NBC_01142]MCX4823171.1 S-methyl-5-thioribose-1-phosphate isomerase [Streptomyces sp. NBC_01142]